MNPTGLQDLNLLLRHLAPELQAPEYVFCSFAEGSYGDFIELTPLAAYQEAEGLTLVIERDTADAHGIAYSATFRAISLRVHSSLEAVGLTAAVASPLAERGISANVIAAFYHDHLFVPSARAEEALAALRALAAEQSSKS